MKYIRYWKIPISALLLTYCLYYFRDSQVAPDTSWQFIDGVDLLIHEAGHVVFMPFGDFMHILGGSLMQILMPMIFVGYFIFRKQFYSASLVMYWVGINFINVSVYAADAVTRKLPLITGNSDDHDWNQLLFMLGWLHKTALVGHVILAAGLIIIAAAFFWGLYQFLSHGLIL